MTQPALSLVAPDLVDAASAADHGPRRNGALAACTFAVRRRRRVRRSTPSVCDWPDQ